MRVGVEAAEGRARVDLAASLLVPRLVGRGDRDAVVAVVAGGALLIDGDAVDVRVRVGAGCRLVLRDVGGTVAYGSSGAASSWTTDISVDDGASLIWHTLPFVVAHRADVFRSTRIRLGRNASALLRETLVLGRHGEDGGALRTGLDVTGPEGAMLRESLVLDGERPQDGVLGRNRVLDTAMSFGRRREAPGALQLHEPGTLVRAMGVQSHVATVDGVWREWADRAVRSVRDAGADGAEHPCTAEIVGAQPDEPGVAARSCRRNPRASRAS